jgi:ankyrin repeat protein
MIDEAGRTMLHLAVLYKQDELALRVMNLKPQFLGKRDAEGKTPWDYAKALGSPIAGIFELNANIPQQPEPLINVNINGHDQDDTPLLGN